MDESHELEQEDSFESDSSYQDAECGLSAIEGFGTGGHNCKEQHAVDVTGSDCHRKLSSDGESEPFMVAGGDLVTVDEDNGSSISFSTDLVEQFHKERELNEIGVLICSTLASLPNGAEPNKLKTLMRGNWGIDMDRAAMEKFDYDSFAQLLGTEEMKDFVEVRAIHGDVIVYGAKVTPAIQHITQTVADEQLSVEQQAQKRRHQRLLELRKPENQETFIEGKRRILSILIDLKAFEEPVSYSELQTAYMKKFAVSLNAQEQSRMFRNKSALKNLRNAFFKEIDLVSRNPMFVKLKSRNITLPSELTEEDRERAVGLGDVEGPVSRDQYDEDLQDTRKFLVSKGRQMSTTAQPQSQPKKGNELVTMTWGDEDESDSQDDEKKNAAGDGSNPSSSPINVDKKTSFGGKNITFTDDEESDEDDDATTGYFGANQNTQKDANSSKKQTRHSLKGESALNRQCSKTNSADVREQGVRKPRNMFSGRHGATGRALRRSVEQTRLAQIIQSSESEWRQTDASSPAPSTGVGHERGRYETSVTMRRPDMERVVHENNSPNTPFPERAHGFRDSNERHVRTSDAQSNTPAIPQRYQSMNRDNDGTACTRPLTSLRKTTYKQNHFQRCHNEYPSHLTEQKVRKEPIHRPQSCSMYASLSQPPLFSPSSEFANMVTVATQTDDTWLDTLMQDLGFMDNNSATPASPEPPSSDLSGSQNANGRDTDVIKLAHIVELLVEFHAPRPILMSDLPMLVQNVYGIMITPLEDPRYRLSWQTLINNYCHGRVKLINIEGNCDILVHNAHPSRG